MSRKMPLYKRILGTLALPLSVYLIMYGLSHAGGKTYFGTWMMWQTLIVDISVAVTMALGIGLQFKSGRFDFSGGGIMLVTGIVAANIAKNNGNDIYLFAVICFAVAILLSVLVALVYVYGRLPIIIATIGMALLFESITTLIYKGSGINLVANMDLNRFSAYPLVLVPLIGAIVVYILFSYLTVTGKQAQLLAHNQQSAVNIGINEKRNVIVSYIYSGAIFGFATMIYSSTGLHKAAFASLSTVGSLFTNILPVFIGLMLIAFCGDTIGIIVGAITLCVMSYGLNVVFSAEMGGAISIIITAIFIFVINVISGQGSNWMQKLKKMLTMKSTQKGV
jgi:ribose transport system permease protein